MKIGIVSDTHSQAIPQQLYDDFKKTDLICHAGDFCDLDVYRRLARIRDVKAVFGNMDNAQIRRRFPRKQIFAADDCRIGIFHGEGPAQSVLETVRKEFAGDHVDAVVFGHSHHPFNEKIGGVLYFNPGSPNDQVFAPYCSYGILQVAGGKVAGKIIRVKA